MSKYEEIKRQLKENPSTWLITGVAGFIGSNLLETLLKLDQNVVGLDNFDTGFKHNLDQVNKLVTAEQWSRFRFIEGDIRKLEDCQDACMNVDYILHQAALGSVPRSIADPIRTNMANIDGFLNMLVAAKDSNIKRFVYAASSSTYGDHPDLPKVEDKIGNPLSPYSVTKVVNELYAKVFSRTYGFKTIGLRYFNVFGKRQNPNGDYAAVIPKWTVSMIKDDDVFINGDGTTSRDFCYIENAIQLNILAATTENPDAIDQVYNCAVGDRTTLNELFEYLRANLSNKFPHLNGFTPTFRDFRAGDVMHSLADISKAENLLGYQPTHRIKQGLEESMTWFVDNLPKDN